MDYLGSTDLGQEFSRAFDKGMEALQEWGKEAEANARLITRNCLEGSPNARHSSLPAEVFCPSDLKGQQVEDFSVVGSEGGAEKEQQKIENNL